MILSELNKKRVIFKHIINLFFSFFKKILDITLFIPKKILNLVFSIASSIWFHFYDNLNLYRKIMKIVLISLTLSYELFNIGFFLFDKYSSYGTRSYNPINVYVLINVIVIISYFILIEICKIFYRFKGIYMECERDRADTEEYITTKMKHILKVFGITGAGKDTFVAGATSVLTRHYRAKTDEDLERIPEEAYIINFNLLALDLEDNFNKFLSNSREILYKNFLKLAEQNEGYIKKAYRKTISFQELKEDYEFFLEAPVEHDTPYAIGVGVSRKHFYDLVLSYIKWWIRKNVEDRYTLFNQPFYEDIQAKKKAKMFSLNFTAVKTIEKNVWDKEAKKPVKQTSRVLFPWKDRLIIGETECDTWYLNTDNGINSILKEMGVRDFKAYQRHLVDGLYWFQIGQNAERTQKTIRELDQGYVGIVAREEIEGGAFQCFLLGFVERYYRKKIASIDNKRANSSYRAMKKQDYIDYLSKLYQSTSEEMYYVKRQKIIDKLKRKKKYKKYEKYKAKLHDVLVKIEEQKKNGYIRQIVVFSDSGSMPADIQPMKIRNVLNDKTLRMTNVFCAEIVHYTRDCEVYDTRYMRNLGEARAKETAITFAEVPEWDSEFLLSKDNITFASYPSAQTMFDVSEDDYNNLLFGDGIDKFKQNPKINK